MLFLDTGYHFAETIGTRDAVDAVYDITVVNVTPEHTVAEQDRAAGQGSFRPRPRRMLPAAQGGAAAQRAEHYSAWVTGIRRVESPTRANAPLIAFDEAFKLVKVNPLAAWTDDDMQAYIEANGVLVNPLVDEGYPSIGCAPCTAKPVEGADPRSGRWQGWQDRVRTARLVKLILTAHGSADPRSAVVTHAVADQIRRLRPSLDVRVAFCEKQ